jgi:hypothetical protein
MISQTTHPNYDRIPVAMPKPELFSVHGKECNCHKCQPRKLKEAS